MHQHVSILAVFGVQIAWVKALQYYRYLIDDSIPRLTIENRALDSHRKRRILVRFVGAFLACAIWESFGRSATSADGSRWGKHGAILMICTVATMVLYRISPVVLAANVSGSRFGILNKPWLPFLVRCVIAILTLDLVRYTTHRLSHAVGPLWRVHQVHHSDPDFDISTALRVHPIEVVLTQGAYLLAVALLAPPLVAVLIAELGSVLQSFFAHANGLCPAGWTSRSGQYSSHPICIASITRKKLASSSRI